MKIVSVPGRLVRDPATRRIVDDAGIDVDPADLSWTRMIADGDVAIADETDAGAPPAPSPAPKSASTRAAPDSEA